MALLSACGGGGGGDAAVAPTSIQLDKTQLTFVAKPGLSPAAQSVRATFLGDGVIVGFAPGVQQPPWLNVYSTANTGTTVDFDLSVNPSPAEQVLTTSVRFVSGHANGTGIVYADLPVTFVVTSEPLTLTPASFAFTAVFGSTAQPTPADVRSVAIADKDVAWTATAPAWITLDRTSGQGPGSIEFTINHAGLQRGTFSGDIRVTNTATGETKAAPVTLTVRAPRLTGSPASASFMLDTAAVASDLAQQLSISDELAGEPNQAGISWTLDPVGVAWLTAGPSSGATTPAATLTLSLVPAQIAGMTNGAYNTTVKLRYSNADGTRTLDIPVSLTRAVPRVSALAPYLGFTDTTQEVVLRGSALGNVTADRVHFGDATAVAVRPISDTSLGVTYAGLAQGLQHVRIDHVLDVDESLASVKVVAPDDMARAGDFAVPYPSNDPIYDQVHHALYYPVPDAGIDWFTLSGGTWTAQPRIVVPNLKDVRLSHDGTSLYAVTGSTLARIDLEPAPAAPVDVATNPGSFCSQFFGAVGMFNDGRVAVIQGEPACSPATAHVFFYDPVQDTLDTGPFFQSANYPYGFQPDNLEAYYTFKRANNQFFTTRVDADTSLETVSNTDATLASYGDPIARDGSKMLLDSLSHGFKRALFDRTLTFIGALDLQLGTQTISPDGSRVYAVDAPNNQVRVFDTSVPPPADGYYPEIGSFAIAGTPENIAGFTSSRVVISDDGRTLFVHAHKAGPPEQLRVFVVPVP